MKYIMIYGAGNYGKTLYNFLKQINVDITCFLETKLSKHGNYDNIPVYPIDKLSEYPADNVIVLISTKNPDISRDIRFNLWTYGLKNNQIISCSDFIEKNNLSKEKDRFCFFCDDYVSEFLPYGTKHEIFDRLHIIGEGFRDNCKCRKCGSLDRERWLYYVLKKYTDIFSDTCSILHFAPESNVSAKIALQNPSAQYITADLALWRAQFKIDIRNIEFESDKFDYVIANHVLEHIVDESTAIQELKRVLKPNGKMILSFPVAPDIDTFEDSSLISEDDRLCAYGQSDHVRLYGGGDYIHRFEEYGLKIQVLSPFMKLNDTDILHFGLLKDDIILICTKNHI